MGRGRWAVAATLAILVSVPFPADAHGRFSFGLGVFIPLWPRPAPVYVPPPEGVGYLRAAVDPPTARVFVDGYPVGRAQDIAGAQVAMLPAGRHRLDIVEAGFLRHSGLLVIAPGRTTEVRVRLLPAPPAPPAPPAAEPPAPLGER